MIIAHATENARRLFVPDRMLRGVLHADPVAQRVVNAMLAVTAETLRHRPFDTAGRAA